MKFTIEGEPVPKGRPRFNRKTGTMYTPPTTRVYEQMVGLLALSQHEKFELEPVCFEALLYTAKKKPADIDNCLKAISDGMNEIAFGDDSQIARIVVERIISANPRVEVSVTAHTQQYE